MHFSLHHVLTSLFAVVFTSSVVDAIPTKIQGDGSSLAKRATDSQAMSRIQYQNYAASAINALQKAYYDPNAGLWGKVDDKGVFSGDWWNSANVLTMMADYYEIYPTTAPWMTDLFATVLAKAPSKFHNFINGFYDDELWWVLAWIQVYDATGNVTYLNTAASLYEDSKSAWGNTPCGGLW